MARYIPLVWKDRNIQRPNTFQVVDNPDGTKTLIPKPGTVVEEGTKVNAENLNHIEQGISDIDVNVNDIKTNVVTVNDSITSLDIESLATIKSIKGRTLKNLALNGDFSSGQNGWAFSNATGSVASNEFTFLANKQWGQIYQSRTSIINNKYYIRALVKANSNLVTLNTQSTNIKAHTGSGNYEMLSAIRVSDTAAMTLIILDGRASGWENIKVKEVLFIDLTAMFGAGKEPTVEWCDSNLQWFNGIKSVGEDENNKITINSMGKNLIDMSKITRDASLTWAGGVVGSENNSFVTDYITINPGGNYIVNYYSQILFYDKNKNYLGNGEGLLASTGIQYKNFKAPSDARIKFLRLGVRSVYNGNLVMYKQNVQLEKGITETTYEPYKSDNLEIQLTEPFRGLPNNVSDEITKGGNVIRRIGKIVLNGSENWGLGVSGSLNISFMLDNPSFKIGGFCISDKFNSISPSEIFPANSTGIAISSSVNRIMVSIEKSKLITQDVNGFKTWLTQNNTTVCYELATPAEEVISQPMNIKTYNKGTILLENSIIPTIEQDVPSNVAGRVSNLEEFIPIINSGIDIVNKELTSHKTSNDHDNRYVKLSDIKNTILNIAYPIGAIYQSVVNTSPAVFLGGTWAEFVQGKTLIGVDKNDTDFSTVEKTGGYKTQPLRALIGATDSDLSKIGYQAGARVPTHDYNRGISGPAFGGASNANINHSTVVKRDDGTEPTTLQPYITVYMWKRTA